MSEVDIELSLEDLVNISNFEEEDAPIQRKPRKTKITRKKVAHKIKPFRGIRVKLADGQEVKINNAQLPYYDKILQYELLERIEDMYFAIRDFEEVHPDKALELLGDKIVEMGDYSQYE